MSQRLELSQIYVGSPGIPGVGWFSELGRDTGVRVSSSKSNDIL